jgi:hypothetical protein
MAFLSALAQDEPERIVKRGNAGRKACRDDGQIDLVAIVAGLGCTARVTSEAHPEAGDPTS